MMSKEEFFRVRILRRVHDGGGERWIRIVDDGVCIDRRYGSRGGWIRVVAPGMVEGRAVSCNPEHAQWYPTDCRGIKVVRIGGGV